jgi:hypothetical protein
MSKGKGGRIRLTIDYGYDIHSIELSQRTLDRIEAGKHVTVKGQGFHADEGREQDYWAFNNKNGTKIEVYCDSGRDVFKGDDFRVEHLD